ncbi:MAG TPA: hypothetical protein VIF09_23155 [Polyangiaceae bacterium]|jgi:hypothetical protein
MTLETVEAYLASLPGGLDAYPDCMHRGDMLALWLRNSPTDGLAERLPGRLAAWLGEAKAATWVPEVHASALYLAIREAHFADDGAFLAHAYECNRAVLDTPGNRLVFWVATPSAILRGAGLRWSTLHRGTSLDVRIRSDQAGDLTMAFPAGLLPEIVLRGNGTGFVAALENAGARNVEVRLADRQPTQARFTGRWTMEGRKG